MKKTVLAILTMLMVAIALSGCNMFAKANGVILYGEEEDILNAVEKEKEKLVKEEQHKIKILTNESLQIMILTDKTAQSLVDKKLITEITNQEKAKTKAITSLPKVAKGEGLLFTKEASPELTTEEINLNIKNEGNLIIGEGRTYADLFLIVNEEDWATQGGTEKTLAVLQYDKDPSTGGLQYDVEKTQLVRIQE